MPLSRHARVLFARRPFPVKGLTVGPCRQQDIPAVARFVARIEHRYGNCPHKPTKELIGSYIRFLTRTLKLDRNYLYCVRDRLGRIVASAQLTPMSISHELGGIYNVMVSPRYHGKRIGDWLISSLVDRARKLNYRLLYLYTHNPKAVNLYGKYGFQRVKYQSKEGVVEMVKDFKKQITTPWDWQQYLCRKGNDISL